MLIISWRLPVRFLGLPGELVIIINNKGAYRKPQKASKKPQGSYTNFQGRNSYNIFVVFFGRNTILPKRHFEINWPLKNPFALQRRQILQKGIFAQPVTKPLPQRKFWKDTAKLIQVKNLTHAKIKTARCLSPEKTILWIIWWNTQRKSLLLVILVMKSLNIKGPEISIWKIKFAWWLIFEKKPFQFWREIWILVVVILLQLYPL